MLTRPCSKLILIAVLAQRCFSGSGCTGDVVAAPGPSAGDCCVGTNEGQSYGAPRACTIPQCIGTEFHLVVWLCIILLPSSSLIICLQPHELPSCMVTQMIREEDGSNNMVEMHNIISSSYIL